MNTRKLFALLLSLVLVSLANTSYAQKKPRWMSPEAGFIDEESDTRVESVTEEDDGQYRVELSVPKVEKPIEEVVVVGGKEEEPSQPLLHVRAEIINDPDEDRSGIILYMGRKEGFVLHINYHDGSRDVVPRPVGGIKP